MKKNPTGFTLVEIVVVVAILLVIMSATTGILLNSFKAKNRTRLTENVLQNGSWAVAEIRKNILNSISSTITCPVGVGSSMTFTAMDGGMTSLTCESGRIASVSASRRVYLTGEEIEITGCDMFVDCDTSLGVVSKVNFSFGIEGGVAGFGQDAFVSKEFNAEVAVRN